MVWDAVDAVYSVKSWESYQQLMRRIREYRKLGIQYCRRRDGNGCLKNKATQ